MLSDVNYICCEIIKTCPLACLHCSANSHINTNKLIPLNELNTIVNQAVKNHINTFFISGGEPLLHPNLKDLIINISAKGITPVLYSSGILPLNKSIRPVSTNELSDLEKVGLDSIAFSIYSLDANIHDNITNKPDSLITLKKTIKNAKDTFRETKIELSFLPLSNTWKEIDNIIKFANSHNIYKLNILKLINQGRAKESGIFLKSLSQEEELQFIKKLKRYQNTSTIIEISKLYDCDHYGHLQESPHTSGINEYFVTYNQELKKGRRFRH